LYVESVLLALRQSAGVSNGKVRGDETVPRDLYTRDRNKGRWRSGVDDGRELREKFLARACLGWMSAVAGFAFE
jgi:hypothetical protein